jgi:hypothetical protein
VYRRLLKMVLEELQFLEQPIVQLEQEMANLLSQHQEAVQRLARCPVWEWLRHGRSLPKWGPELRRLTRRSTRLPGWEPAPEMMRAREYPRATAPPRATAKCGAFSNQCANAAVRTKGSIFEIVYRLLVLRLGHNQTIGAITNRICRLIWIILHRGVCYEERGQVVCERLQRTRTARMIRQLRSLGYRVEPLTVQVTPA